MRLINRSTDKQADLNKVLDYVSKSFTSADDEAAYAVYDANNINHSLVTSILALVLPIARA